MVNCSKISNNYLLVLLLSNKVLFFRAGIHKMLVRIANRQDSGQAASLEAVCLVLYCLRLFWQVINVLFKINKILENLL